MFDFFYSPYLYTITYMQQPYLYGLTFDKILCGPVFTTEVFLLLLLY